MCCTNLRLNYLLMYGGANDQKYINGLLRLKKKQHAKVQRSQEESCVGHEVTKHGSESVDHHAR